MSDRSSPKSFLIARNRIVAVAMVLLLAQGTVLSTWAEAKEARVVTIRVVPADTGPVDFNEADRSELLNLQNKLKLNKTQKARLSALQAKEAAYNRTSDAASPTSPNASAPASPSGGAQAGIAPGAPSGGISAGGAPAAGAPGTLSGYVKLEEEATALSDDKCAYSDTLDGKMGCNMTETLVTGAQVTNQVTQTLGASAVQMMGQQEAAKASMSGKQSDTYNAGAKMADTTGNIELGTGTLNVALGGVLLWKSMQHKKYAKEGKLLGQGKVIVNADGTAVAAGRSAGARGDVAMKHDPNSPEAQRVNRNAATASREQRVAAASERTQQAIDQFEMNQMGQFNQQAYVNEAGMPTGMVNESSKQAKAQHLQNVLRKTGTKIASEQGGAASSSMAQGVSSMVTGAGQLMMGASHKMMAKAMRKSAEQIESFESANPIVPLPVLAPGNGAQVPAYGGMMAPVIIGSEPTPDGNATSAPVETVNDKDEEKPVPLGLPPEKFAGIPTPGPQLANGAGSPDSGSPASVSGSGISGGGGPGSGDGGPAGVLPNERDPRYAGGGGGGGASGAYGGGSGGGGDSGPDLSGMIEKMMGAQKEGEVAQQPGLEEFGRDPASEMPYSFLDKSVNIFQRVHQTYQVKAKAGRVSLH